MNAVPPGPPLAPDVDAALQRARFDLAIAAAGIGTFDWDLVTGELVWDDRLLAIFGYSAETFDRTIQAFTDRLHPDDRERVLQGLDNSVRSGVPYEVEYRILWPSGDTRWIEARGQSIFDRTGTPVRFLGAALDSTDLREGQARLGRLLETMPAGFVSVNRNWRLTYINAKAERLLQIRRSEDVGRRLWDVFPEVVDSPFETACRAALATGMPQTVDGRSPRVPRLRLQVQAFPADEGLSLYLLDVTESRLREELLALESRVGEQLAESLDLGAAVRELARLVVPRLGDWSLVTVTDPDGTVRDVASWHRDPALRPAVARYAAHRFDGISTEAPILQVQQSREPRVVESGLTELMRPLLASPEARQALEVLRPESAVIVPLVARGQLVGILSLCRRRGRRPISGTELAVALSVSRRAAMALDNARLFAEQRAANQRLRRSFVHERTVARALQDAMLTRLPTTATIDLQARYLPAGNDVQVGGDWYDALMLPGGSKALMIGDVVGHDIGAAAVMGQLRNLLRGFVWDRDESPADTVGRLDRAIRDLQIETLATLALVRIDAGSEHAPRTVRWTSAGHPPPVLIGPGGRAAFLEQVADPLLGVLPGAARTTQTVQVPPGSTLLLYTDGLIERRDVDLLERRAALLERLEAHAGKPLGELLDAVTTDLVGENRDDDVAVLAARFR